MKCMRCGSLSVMRFIDGFGQRRVFCRKCWGSFLDRNAIRLRNQKRLQDFRPYYPQELSFKRK